MEKLYEDRIIHRMNRIEGQLHGIVRMMKEDASCKDVVTQLSATRSAIDRVIGLVVSENLIGCVKNDETEENHEQAVAEAVQLLLKSR
ncbi:MULTISPECIES: metal-sensitive transcriptional regulator [Exiguobacterium]|uniref:Cytoplasmic protein n=1 Tax=Exiguobacterium oxidotolerans TaxID=223958 RepID=A0A653I4A4_9BACL|nr:MULTISPECIES: metal-sensitive transcriptional regulator [Exiguobacterium]ASI34345.1 cytoplasmic protein [Exiguobacterium sp. N4-1P]VWX33802.1 Cytoplasmic protein [Exiguobacterium oxidotolerans]